jgi:hypothetical protein
MIKNIERKNDELINKKDKNTECGTRTIQFTQ